jgi:hypothetical protein
MCEALSIGYSGEAAKTNLDGGGICADYQVILEDWFILLCFLGPSGLL